MLDKTKVYSGFASPRKPHSLPSANFKRVKILFEDDISYYVESLTSNDAAGHGIRYSVKKHCYELVEYRRVLRPMLCKHDVGTMDHMIDALLSYQIFINASPVRNLIYQIRDLLWQSY